MQDINTLRKELGCLFPYIKITIIFSKDLAEKVFLHVEQFQGWQNETQIMLLHCIAMQHPGARLLEIGAYKGRSISAFCTGDNNLRIVCVDTFKSHHQNDTKEDTQFAFLENLTFFNHPERVFPLRCSSEQASEILKDEAFDLIFVDGDHSADGVRSDIVNYFPKLRRGGLMFGHDYPHPEDSEGGFNGLYQSVNQEVRDKTEIFEDFGFFCGIWAARKK